MQKPRIKDIITRDKPPSPFQTTLHDDWLPAYPAIDIVQLKFLPKLRERFPHHAYLNV